MVLGARLGKVSAIIAREGPASVKQYNYQAKGHLLHSASVLGRAKNAGSWTADLPQQTRCRDSKEYQVYEEEMGMSPPFVVADDLVKVVGIWCGLSGTGKRPKMFKVSNEEAWCRHILNNHQPFRRDCALCLRNGGVGRQHRATPNPRAYVLSVDVAGTFEKKRPQCGRKGFPVLPPWSISVSWRWRRAILYQKEMFLSVRIHLPPPSDVPVGMDEEELENG